MQKLKALAIKNVSGMRQFFAPLNKHVEFMGKVDVLAMCEGNSETALKIAHSFRNDKNWQVFELFDGPAPSPEGMLDNASAIGVPASRPEASPGKTVQPQPVKKGKIKDEAQSHHVQSHTSTPQKETVGDTPTQ